MNDFALHRSYHSPHFCFHVHTNDQLVLDLIESYLDCGHSALCCEPFFELHYCITYFDPAELTYDHRILASGPSHSKLSDSEYFVEIGDRLATVTVNVATLGVTADLYRCDCESGVIDIVFFYPCRMLLAYRGWLYVHGAHVTGSSHDLIFIGQSGAGKSSLARSLTQRPQYSLHSYCQQSDDIVFIKADRRHNYCLPLPTLIGFRNKALEKDLADQQPSIATYGDKQRFSTGFSEYRCLDVTARKTVIVRPRYDDGVAALLVEPEVKKDKVVDDIAAVTFPMCDINLWGSKYDEAREMLAAFVRRADVVRLTYNDRLLPEVPFAFSERW
jgi:hypothetical protein